MSDWQPSEIDTDPAPTDSGTSADAVLAFDAQRYRPYVEDLALSEEAKTELLATLWSVMATFVDLGFGVDSVQRILQPFTEAVREETSGPEQIGDNQSTSSGKEDTT